MWAFSHHLASVRPSSVHNYKTIFSSETAQPILTKLWWDGPWVVLFQNCVRRPRPPNKMAARLKIEKRGGGWFLKIFSSETAWPILTKLWWNSPWVVLFQNCVRQPRPPNKMAARLKIEKRGMKFLKYSSLKVISQSSPNLAGMILGWSFTKIMSDDPDLRTKWPPG